MAIDWRHEHHGQINGCTIKKERGVIWRYFSYISSAAIEDLCTYAQYNSIYGAIDNKQVAEYC